MATFEKTWAFDLNRAYTPASALDLTRYTMWLLAATLTGNIGGLTQGLWTLYASSNSVTAGTDSTDRWVLAGPYDGTKIVRGSGAAAHSWIVLKSPTIHSANFYMILSFNSAADDKIRISFMKTAPTGGSTTATPTSTDQWWPNNTSLAAADWAMNAAAADNSRFSTGLTSAGDFYFVGCKQLAGLPNLIITFHGLSNKKASDLYPVWAAVEYRSGGVARINNGNWIGTAGNPGAAVGGNAGRHAISGVWCVNPWLIPAYNDAGGAGTASNTPAVADSIDGTYQDWPIWIMMGSAGAVPSGVRGRLADFAFCANTVASLAEASVSPASGSPDSSRCGNLWLPANAAFNFN
jgi:hypothetical protein